MTVSVKYASSLHIHTEEGTIEIDQWSNLDPKIYSAIGARAGLSKSSPSTCDGEGDRAKRGGGAPPSVADATATSPSQVDGEEQGGSYFVACFRFAPFCCLFGQTKSS